MTEIKRILCPIDFSEYSRRALDHASAIARWYEASVTLFNVCPLVPATTSMLPGAPMLPVMVPTPEDLEALREAMKRFADVEIGSSLPLQYEVGEGNAASEILDRARTMSADLIVMGTHGRSGFERFMLGSVAEKVLRKASCAVLTVPRLMADAVPAPPVLYARILCPVDFSDCSLRALEYAMSLAEETGAHLTLAHIVEVFPSPALEPENPFGSRSLGEYVTASVQDRARRLLDLIPASARDFCTVDTVMAIGKSYAEILRIAAERHSELIVLGTHGHVISELFFGSTAQHVVRQATCPVLTIRTR